MKDIRHISEVMLDIASDPTNEFSQVLNRCSVMLEIKEALLKKGKISLDNLSNEEIENLSEKALLEDWIDGQEVMQKLHISPRTLQTLRTNGTIPYTRIGHKLYYLKQDIERILRNNYVMFNINKRYGKDN